jgi:predicted dehydrogenase
MTLRAVVIGAGWAGEGHIIGLRDAGVDVIALFGRTPEPAYERGAQLGITDVRFDWRSGLVELRPEIVSIATPADSHRAIAELLLNSAVTSCARNLWQQTPSMPRRCARRSNEQA